MMLKSVAAVFLSIACCLAGNQTSAAEQVNPKDPQAIKSKKTNKKKNTGAQSEFDPADFIKKKQAHELNGPGKKIKKAGRPISIGEKGVICNPGTKPTDSDRQGPVLTDQQASENSESLINDSTRLTKEVMKTIKENCKPTQDSEAYVKPIFEVGIKEPPAGTTEKKEVVPKVGIQATF